MTRHKFDFLSFFFGTVFILIGIAFGLGENPWTLALDFSEASRWIGPAVLLIIGFALVRPVFRTGKPVEQNGAQPDFLQEEPPASPND